MKENEVRLLTEKGLYNGQPLKGQLEETHISWVILSEKHAFKLKKPVKLSFLDFSTPELRREYCEKEVALNSRFTDIYEAVVPVSHTEDSWHLGDGKGAIVDYAVQMKRLLTARRMDKMLEQNKVSIEGVKVLARQVADFHQKADKIYIPFQLTTAKALFNDIGDSTEVIEKNAGSPYAKAIDEAIQWSDDFLEKHSSRLQKRIDRGLLRDVHGDLHSGNVFLYKKPVIFDCIEFNDQYRQTDVLYEVAFMCMDLEAFRQPRLAEIFLNTYSDNFPCFEVEEDRAIFNYFKCLRANVRAKVHTLSIAQGHETGEVQRHIDEVKKYINLMTIYMAHKAYSALP